LSSAKIGHEIDPIIVLAHPRREVTELEEVLMKRVPPVKRLDGLPLEILVLIFDVVA